jgi:hypothetical protein
MKGKKVRKEVWWGVEYMEHGKNIGMLDLRKHRNVAEAKVCFSVKMKKSWKALEKQGAEVVRHPVWMGLKPPDWFSIG